MEHRSLYQWLAHHKQAILASLQDLYSKPLATLMTLAVIGIAIALPSGLYVLLKNLQAINQHWNNKPGLSLYLKKGTPDYQINDLLTSIRNNPNVANVTYISPREGLKEFKTMTPFGNVLSELEENPLPGVIVITPIKSQQAPADLQRLSDLLQKNPAVDIAQLDMAWVKRLYYIVTIGNRIAYALTLLFGLGVFLIVGNTIRLLIQRHKEEMVILKLVGATNAFVRRPLLYCGLWYGLCGGLFAWLLVISTLYWLKAPAESLAHSYKHTLVLQGLPFATGLGLLAGAATLGLLGAYFVTHRQLASIDPE